MALVFRNSSEEPARCALEIAQALKAHPEIRVRMGIHSGPVSEVTDVNGRTNIAGAGINMAQRVMDCGDAGHILLSQRVAEDLAQYRQWAPHLHDLGECEVKHGLKLSLTNLYARRFGQRGGAGKVGRARRATVRRAPSRPGASRGFTVSIAVGLLSAGLFFLGHFPLLPKPGRRRWTVPEKSIAVLPFENLSERQRERLLHRRHPGRNSDPLVQDR